jgi:hypothetical protein
MRDLRVLDAFCCEGGATRGYQAAGFHVTGVDIVPRPDYCGDEFVLGDAVEYIRAHGHEYDIVHNSPPCQGEGAPTKGTNAARNAEIGREHPRLITATRAALEAVGVPYVIENVAGSTVRKDLMLCGDYFGLGVIMHRYFEFGGGAPIPTVPHDPRHMPKHDRRHGGRRVRGWRHGVYYDGPYVAAYGKGGGKATVAEMQVAKGIDWTDDHEALREALPPAYTEYIGRALVAHLEAVEVAA